MEPIVLKPVIFVAKNQLSRTAMTNKGYLDDPLTISVDPELRGNSQYQENIKGPIQRPPGVETLRQWGQIVIPSGKHAGQSFAETHSDMCYVHQVWNRKAVSPWLRSFQMYCRMRQHAAPTSEEIFDKVEKEPQKTAAAMAAPKGMIKINESKMSPPAQNSEWTKIESSAAVSSETNRKPKRGSATGSTTGMETEINHQRVQELKTQIAILERQRAIETQVPETEPEKKPS